MQESFTQIAESMAQEAGAEFIVSPGVAYDTTDVYLKAMVEALLPLFQGCGIDLLSLRREGHTLIAYVDESEAEEPLCPAAFTRMVRKFSPDLHAIWNGKLEFAPERRLVQQIAAQPLPTYAAEAA